MLSGKLHNISNKSTNREKLTHAADNPQQFTLTTNTWSEHTNFKNTNQQWHIDKKYAARSWKGVEHKENSCNALRRKACTTRGSGFAVWTSMHAKG